MTADLVWYPIRANNSDANMAESVLSAAESFLDTYGVGGMSLDLYRNEPGCTMFSWGTGRELCVAVRWHTCCEEHPIVIEAVEFRTC